jgi:hypothetical protein
MANGLPDTGPLELPPDDKDQLGLHACAGENAPRAARSMRFGTDSGKQGGGHALAPSLQSVYRPGLPSGTRTRNAVAARIRRSWGASGMKE